MTPSRRLHFDGPFDVRAGRELEQIAAFVIRGVRSAQRSPTVHVDLSLVTRVDDAAVPYLNRAWAVLAAAGWAMEVETPDHDGARWPFIQAAIRGEFAWARGSTAPAAATRAPHVGTM